MALRATIAQYLSAGGDPKWVLPKSYVRDALSDCGSNGAKRLRVRGFTLVELMIVVSIIALFAGLAAPSVTRLVKDQRVLKQTLNVMNVYREAQARAMGRGAAVVVTYNSTGDAPSNGPFWQVYESRDANGLPFPECVRTAWPPTPPAAGFGTGILLYSVGIGTENGTALSQTAATLYSTTLTGAGFTTGGTCFSPKGRVFVKVNAAIAWTELSHMLFTTQRMENGAPVGLARGFTVSGTGISRMVEPCQVDTECPAALPACVGGVCQ